MTLTAMEFLRRFVQHVLPRGFVRMRQCGYLANACRTARLARARALLACLPVSSASPDAPATVWTCPTVWGVPTLDHRPSAHGTTTNRRLGRLLRYLVNAKWLLYRRASVTCPPTWVSWSLFASMASPVTPPARLAHPGVNAYRGRHHPEPRRSSRSSTRTERQKILGSWLHSGRRASGFLQVSLSKVPRHQQGAHPIISGRRTSDER